MNSTCGSIFCCLINQQVFFSTRDVLCFELAKSEGLNVVKCGSFLMVLWCMVWANNNNNNTYIGRIYWESQSFLGSQGDVDIMLKTHSDNPVNDYVRNKCGKEGLDQLLAASLPKDDQSITNAKFPAVWGAYWCIDRTSNINIQLKFFFGVERALFSHQ